MDVNVDQANLGKELVQQGLKSLATLTIGRRLLGSAILHIPDVGWTIFFLVSAYKIQPKSTGGNKRKRGTDVNNQKGETEEDVGNAIWMEYTTYTFHADNTVTDEPVIPEDTVQDVSPEERHRFIAEALTVVGVHRVYAPDFGNICYLLGTNVERFHTRMESRLRLLVAANHASVQEQLAIVQPPDSDSSIERPFNLYQPAVKLLVIGCGMFLPLPKEGGGEWSVWWLIGRDGMRPCRWLFERQSQLSERAKWQYPLLAMHQLGSTVMAPSTEGLEGILFVNLLDVGDQTVERRGRLMFLLEEMLVALREAKGDTFPDGDYLETTEEWYETGSELGEESVL